jgi:hypothetical protein
MGSLTQRYAKRHAITRKGAEISHFRGHSFPIFTLRWQGDFWGRMSNGIPARLADRIGVGTTAWRAGICLCSDLTLREGFRNECAYLQRECQGLNGHNSPCRLTYL